MTTPTTEQIKKVLAGADDCWEYAVDVEHTEPVYLDEDARHMHNLSDLRRIVELEEDRDETVADYLVTLMDDNDVENFVMKNFSTSDGRKFNLTCQFTDSTVGPIDKLRADAVREAAIHCCVETPQKAGWNELQDYADKMEKGEL